LLKALHLHHSLLLDDSHQANPQAFFAAVIDNSVDMVPRNPGRFFHCLEWLLSLLPLGFEPDLNRVGDPKHLVSSFVGFDYPFIDLFTQHGAPFVMDVDSLDQARFRGRSPAGIAEEDIKYISIDADRDLVKFHHQPLWLEFFLRRGFIPSAKGFKLLLDDILKHEVYASGEDAPVSPTWAAFFASFPAAHPALKQTAKLLPSKGPFAEVKAALTELLVS